MKTLTFYLMQIKTFAAWIFSGMICLYMAGGALYQWIYSDPNFNYTIPFIFLLEGIVLALVIPVLYGLFFSEMVIKKWRYFPRLVLFVLSLLILLALCVLVFFAVPTYWAKLWWLAIGAAAAIIVLLSIIAELYFLKTGKRYTEILKNYKSGIS